MALSMNALKKTQLLSIGVIINSVAAMALTRSFAVLVVAATALGVMSGVLDSLGNRYQTAIRDRL